MSTRAVVVDSADAPLGGYLYGVFHSALDGAVFLSVGQVSQGHLTRRVGGEFRSLDAVPAGRGISTYAPVNANRIYLATFDPEAPTQTGGALGIVDNGVYSEIVSNLASRTYLALGNNILYVAPLNGSVFRLEDDQLVDLGIPMTGFISYLWHSGTSLYVVHSKVFGGGSLWVWDGVSWSLAFESDKKLGQLWGSSDDDLWLPELNGALYRFDGMTWETVPELSNRFLVGLRGTSASNVFSFSASEVWHYNGVSWAPVALGETGYLDVLPTSSALYFIGSNSGGGAFSMPFSN